MLTRGVRVTVSGSFHRHLSSIGESVECLTVYGAKVLSPADPRVVDRFGEFLFVASDLRRSIRGIQNRHLDAIRTSDYLWLECEDGYVGLSAAFEVGYAVAKNVPIMASCLPHDHLIRRYVKVAAQPLQALHLVADTRSNSLYEHDVRQLSLLLNPRETVDAVHVELEKFEQLARSRGRFDTDLAHGHLQEARELLTLPADHLTDSLSDMFQVTDTTHDVSFPLASSGPGHLEIEPLAHSRNDHDYHLNAIRSLRFVWLEHASGFIDIPTAFKIGYATAVGTPIFSACPLNDLTLRQYVSIAAMPVNALRRLQGLRNARHHPGQLALSLDPCEASITLQLGLRDIYLELVSATHNEEDPIEKRIIEANQILTSLMAPL